MIEIKKQPDVYLTQRQFDKLKEENKLVIGTVYHITDATYVYSVNNKSGIVELTKEDLGLGNVDNTSDSEKQVLSAEKLTTPRTINGVEFDGTEDIQLPGSPGIYYVTKYIKEYSGQIPAFDIQTNGNTLKRGDVLVDSNSSLAMVNSITKLTGDTLQIGDQISKLYFDTTKFPQASDFDWSNSQTYTANEEGVLEDFYNKEYIPLFKAKTVVDTSQMDSLKVGDKVKAYKFNLLDDSTMEGFLSSLEYDKDGYGLVFVDFGGGSSVSLYAVRTVIDGQNTYQLLVVEDNFVPIYSTASLTTEQTNGIEVIQGWQNVDDNGVYTLTQTNDFLISAINDNYGWNGQIAGKPVESEERLFVASRGFTDGVEVFGLIPNFPYGFPVYATQGEVEGWLSNETTTPLMEIIETSQNDIWDNYIVKSPVGEFVHYTSFNGNSGSSGSNSSGIYVVSKELDKEGTSSIPISNILMHDKTLQVGDILIDTKGTNARVNSVVERSGGISVGNQVSALYFNQDVLPDLSQLDWSNAQTFEAEDNMLSGMQYVELITFTMEGRQFSIDAFHGTVEGSETYLLVIGKDGVFYASAFGGWMESEQYFDTPVTIDAVYQQDIWSSFISNEDGAFGASGLVLVAEYEVISSKSDAPGMYYVTGSGLQFNSGGEVSLGDVETLGNKLKRGDTLVDDNSRLAIITGVSVRSGDPINLGDELYDDLYYNNTYKPMVSDFDWTNSEVYTENNESLYYNMEHIPLFKAQTIVDTTVREYFNPGDVIKSYKFDTSQDSGYINEMLAGFSQYDNGLLTFISQEDAGGNELPSLMASHVVDGEQDIYQIAVFDALANDDGYVIVYSNIEYGGAVQGWQNLDENGVYHIVGPYGTVKNTIIYYEWIAGKPAESRDVSFSAFKGNAEGMEVFGLCYDFPNGDPIYVDVEGWFNNHQRIENITITELNQNDVWNSYIVKSPAGEFISYTSFNRSYNDINDKPSINNHPLEGNLSLDDLGIGGKSAGIYHAYELLNLSGYGNMARSSIDTYDNQLKYSDILVDGNGTIAQVRGITQGIGESINPGDTFNTMYFDTSFTPNFDEFDWSSAEVYNGEEGNLLNGMEFIKLFTFTQWGSEYSFDAFRGTYEGNPFYALVHAKDGVMYVNVQGWVESEHTYDEPMIVNEVYQQDIWMKYIFKTPSGEVVDYEIISSLLDANGKIPSERLPEDIGSDENVFTSLAGGQPIEKIVFNPNISIEKMTNYLSSLIYDETVQGVPSVCKLVGIDLPMETISVYAIDFSALNVVVPNTSGYGIAVIDTVGSGFVLKQAVFATEYNPANGVLVDAIKDPNYTYEYTQAGWSDTNDYVLDTSTTHTIYSVHDNKVSAFIGRDTRLWDILSMFSLASAEGVSF